MKKEEGATAAASPTFPQYSGQLRFLSSGRTGSVLPRTPTKQWERVINYQKCPTNETKRRFLEIKLIGPPKQMKQTKQNAAESDNRLKNIRL